MTVQDEERSPGHPVVYNLLRTSTAPTAALGHGLAGLYGVKYLKLI